MMDSWKSDRERDSSNIVNVAVLMFVVPIETGRWRGLVITDYMYLRRGSLEIRPYSLFSQSIGLLFQ